MKRVITPLFALCLLLVGIVPAFAQDIEVSDMDLSGTYDWNIGASVSYPDGWEAVLDDDGYMHLRSEETDIVFGFFFIEEAGDTLESFIEESFEATVYDTSLRFDDDNFLYGNLPNYPIVAYSYTETFDGSSYERTFFALQLNDGLAVVGTAIPRFDDAISEYEAIFAILNSFEMREVEEEPDTSTDSGGLGGLLGGSDNEVTQEEGQYTWSFDIDDATIEVTVEYTDMWELSFDDDDAEHLTSENSDIVFSFYRVEDEDEDTMEAFVQQNFENTRIDGTIDFDEDALVIGELTNFDRVVAYQYLENFEGDMYNRIIIAVQPHPQMIVTAAAIPLRGRDITELEDILAVVDTITAEEVGSGGDGSSSGKR